MEMERRGRSSVTPPFLLVHKLVVRVKTDARCICLSFYREMLIMLFFLLSEYWIYINTRLEEDVILLFCIWWYLKSIDKIYRVLGLPILVESFI